MIKRAANYFGSVPPVFTDGCLYALIAFFIFSQSYLGGDEAAKYVPPTLKFWLNYFIGGAGAFFGAVKMFRSTAYGDHVAEKAAKPISYTPEPGKDTPTP